MVLSWLRVVISGHLKPRFGNIVLKKTCFFWITFCDLEKRKPFLQTYNFETEQHMFLNVCFFTLRVIQERHHESMGWMLFFFRRQGVSASVDVVCWCVCTFWWQFLENACFDMLLFVFFCVCYFIFLVRCWCCERFEGTNVMEFEQWKYIV